MFDEVKLTNISVLDLPAVKGIELKRQPGGVSVSWHPVTLDDIKPSDLRFKGYNVYRLTKGGIIPKKPLNKTCILETVYVDRYKKETICTVGYLVRAVFSVRKETFYAPASRIAKVS